MIGLGAILSANNNTPPSLVYDAVFNATFGANPFYVRLDDITNTGTSVVINDSTVADATWVGKSINIKRADNLRYTGRTVSFYTTITAVSVDGKTLTIASAAHVNIANGSGYAFHDNSAAFLAAKAAASASGKSYLIQVPLGTYVMPDISSTAANADFSGGAPLFIGASYGTTLATSVSFKMFKEEYGIGEQVKEAVYNFANQSKLSAHLFGFKNVSLIPVDCYGFAPSDGLYLIKFPVGTDVPTSGQIPNFILQGGSMALEKGLYTAAINAYLTRKGYANTSYFSEVYFPFASNAIFTMGNLGLEAQKAQLTIEDYNVGKFRCFTVPMTTFNVRRGTHVTWKNLTVKGTHSIGRQGISDDDTKPIINIEADVDGDFTILRIDPSSIAEFGFNDYTNQYDQYFLKRPNDPRTSILIRTSEEIANRKLFINNTKPYASRGVKIGVITHVINAGGGVYDVLLTKDAGYSNAGSYFEKVNGAVQFDTIISDNNGTLANVDSNTTTSLVNYNTGFARDYRGWCVYKYGDAVMYNKEIGMAERAELVFGASDTNFWSTPVEFFIDNDNATALINEGDSCKIGTLVCYVKQVTEIEGIGSKVVLWKSATSGLLTQSFYNDGQTLVTLAGELIGSLLFAFRIQTGNRTTFPNGAAFVVGETLYAHYLGHNDVGGSGTHPDRRQGTTYILPKNLAYPTALTGITLDKYAMEGTETHFNYADGSTDYTIENVDVVEGDFSLFIRDKGGVSAGQIMNLKNSDQDFTGGMQFSSAAATINLDGGIFKIYNSPTNSVINTRNNPSIIGAVHASTTIVPLDATGYTLNGTFYPS